MPSGTSPRTDAAARVRHTRESDLPDIARLWNDGAVMALVGFPDGLGVDAEQLASWWAAVQGDPRRRHFTIEHDELGYCGEAHYRVAPDDPVASVDIKLLPHARGHGLGVLGLGAALDELAARGLAERAYVDPHRDNAPALRLYERLGFRPAPWPDGRAPDLDHLYLDLELTLRAARDRPPRRLASTRRSVAASRAAMACRGRDGSDT